MKALVGMMYFLGILSFFSVSLSIIGQFPGVYSPQGAQERQNKKQTYLKGRL